ncbi:MAG: hypothetical protein ABS910_05695 [Arthrobacter sp.]
MSKLAYNIEEAALATGYSVDTIRKAIRNNEIVTRYANTKPVITATELTDWLDSLPSEAPSK